MTNALEWVVSQQPTQRCCTAASATWRLWLIFLKSAARVSRPDLRVLFITGYAKNAAVGNGLLDHGMEMLTKPFAMEALASRIKEMITTK